MPIKVKEISVEEYDRGFRAYLDRCGNRGTLLEELLQYIRDIAAKKGAPLNVLSIGAGYGAFEDNLFNQPGIKVSYFHGIEISPEYRIILEEKCQTTWSIEKYFIDGAPFNEKYSFPENVNYDLILFIHSLYYMPNPTKSVAHAIHHLSQNDYSKVVIALIGELGSCQLNKEMATSFEWVDTTKYQLDHTLSGEKLISLLGQSNDELIQRRMKNLIKTEVKGNIDVTDILAKTEAGNDVVKFMIMTDLDKEGIDRSYKEKFFAKVKSLVDPNLPGTKIPQKWIALSL